MARRSSESAERGATVREQAKEAVALDFEFLHPYQSLIVGVLRPGEKTSGLLGRVLQDVSGALKLPSSGRTIVSLGTAHKEGPLEIAGLHYVVEKQPPWTSAPGVTDRLNHIALIFRRRRHVAIHVSETAVRHAITDRFDRSTFAGLGVLEPVPARLLNAAFVDGPAKTLWLSGIHGRTSVKADSKTLSGLNLRDALDPLGDQTYCMTAARSKVPVKSIASAVGVAPRGSRIWMSASANWQACKDAVTAGLDHLASQEDHGTDVPLPFVAITSDRLDALGTAFEMGIIPPQLLIDDPTLDPTAVQELEWYSEQTRFVIEDCVGNEVTARVILAGDDVGQAAFRLVARKHGRIAVETATASENEQLRGLLHHCERDHWLRIWFDSGDTFTGDGLFRVQFKDYPFDHFDWDEFAGIDVTREKPKDPIDPDEIGKDNSLFCWTLCRWPLDKGDQGWLVCDDGAMELADFIQLHNNTLTLIHAKGANSDAPEREISVAKYEVVTSQAIKSLRWLDQQHLRDGVAAGLAKKVGKAVWCNRKRSNRDEFLNALNVLGSGYRRRVVILQPQVTQRNLAAGATSTDRREHTRYQQLMTLLNAARASCASLGAELYVIGQKT